jgi:threonine dehydrogenase-like Zn-dependent dehydrogenase
LGVEAIRRAPPGRRGPRHRGKRSASGVIDRSGWNTKRIPDPKVFDLTLPLDKVAEGYRAMDERRAIKTLLRP